MILTLCFCSFSFAPKNTIKSCETESLSTLDRLVTALSLLVCMVLCTCASLCVHAWDCEHAMHHFHTCTSTFFSWQHLCLHSVLFLHLDQHRLQQVESCLFFFCLFSWFKVKSAQEAPLIFFLIFRLVVSSLESLESCFAVGSSSEKVKRKTDEDFQHHVLKKCLNLFAFFGRIVDCMSLTLCRRRIRLQRWSWPLYSFPCQPLQVCSSRQRDFLQACTPVELPTTTIR